MFSNIELINNLKIRKPNIRIKILRILLIHKNDGYNSLGFRLDMLWGYLPSDKFINLIK